MQTSYLAAARHCVELAEVRAAHDLPLTNADRDAFCGAIRQMLWHLEDQQHNDKFPMMVALMNAGGLIWLLAMLLAGVI